jgi:hypothetical protein
MDAGKIVILTKRGISSPVNETAQMAKLTARGVRVIEHDQVPAGAIKGKGGSQAAHRSPAGQTLNGFFPK